MDSSCYGGELADKIEKIANSDQSYCDELRNYGRSFPKHIFRLGICMALKYLSENNRGVFDSEKEIMERLWDVGHE